MSVDITHLWERSSTGPYWFKRAVPKDLVSVIGKKQIAFTLKTRDPKRAARLIAMHAEEQDKHWAELRNPTREGSIARGRQLLAQGGIDPVSPEEAEEGARWAFEEMLEAHLPEHLREADSVDPKELDRHLPPVERAALQMYQGRLEHMASDCLREYLKVRTDGKRSVNAATLPFEYLIKLVGDKPLRNYRRTDVRQFVDQLLAGAHSPTATPIATTTVKRYITTLRAAFALSIREHDLDITNVWGGTIDFPKGAKGAEKRETFTVEQYRHLYRALDQHAATVGADQLRCILVLVAETGARLAEIVGLACADIHLTAAVPYLDLHTHPWRTLKTDGSVRKVPMTPKALETAQTALKLAAGSRFLFPAHTDAERNKADSVSATLNDWIRSRDGLTGTKLSNHSLRHGMEDLLRAVGCPGDVRDRITGHKTPGMGANYGEGFPMEMLAEYLTRATAPLATR